MSKDGSGLDEEATGKMAQEDPGSSGEESEASGGSAGAPEVSGPGGQVDPDAQCLDLSGETPTPRADLGQERIKVTARFRGLEIETDVVRDARGDRRGRANVLFAVAALIVAATLAPAPALSLVLDVLGDTVAPWEVLAVLAWGSLVPVATALAVVRMLRPGAHPDNRHDEQ